MVGEYLSGLLKLKTKTERPVVKNYPNTAEELIIFPKAWVSEFKTKFVKYKFVTTNEKTDLFNRLSSSIRVYQCSKKEADDIILNKTNNKYLRLPKSFTKQLFNPSKFIIKMQKEIDEKKSFLELTLSEIEKQKIIDSIPEKVKKKLRENKYKEQRELF